ncbi:MAG: tetratricopeptide repeat protein [Candidatus Cyclobacteriaceae bacterium M2_1C_046]
MVITKRTYIFFISAALILLSGCSAERKNILSKTYHNTTARYNAYFYAKEQINEIEQKVEESHEDNYGRILRIYPTVDSALAASYKDNVEEAIKMASIAIERHKNSKWVDDSYILVGRARFYDLDFENAIKTYKYVNKESEDKNARHEALIRLIRTFVDYGELPNAKSVADYLDKEKLNKKNRKHLYITKAYLYQVQGDLDQMVSNLVKAAPLLKKKDDKARILYITGQIYQDLGFDSEAYNYYKRSIASNPEYELDFHARLNLAQVTQLKGSGDLKSARKVFEKLLEDKKNNEFQDKIYYEWAKFEAKQGNLETALDHFQVASNKSSSPRQKGLSFYHMATIYYDSLNNYKKAQAYYDSTLSIIPRDEEINFTLIEKRHEVLDDFVKYLNVLQRNDSLLAIASMDSLAIRTLFEAQLKAEQLALEEEKAARKKSRRQTASLNNNSFYMDANASVSSSWYFNNASAKAIGQNDFIRTWGDRPLADYWRISDKIEQQRESQAEETSTNLAEGEAGEAPAEKFNIEQEINLLFAQLPLTAESKEQAYKEIEEAYYHLGNIYNLSLNEKENALSEFESLLGRFPETEHEAEVLYQLFLIYKSIDSSAYVTYKNRLLEKHPNSKFAKLAENPNYTEESNAVAEEQKIYYKTAYQMYDTGGYIPALQLINETIRETEETYFTSHLELLRILIIGKLENISRYQFSLSEFIKKYPDSELNPYARQLLEVSKEMEDRKKVEKGIAYIPYFEQQHYFVLIYPSDKNMEAFSEAIEGFNSQYKNVDLKTSNLILSEEYSMILVTEFTNNTFAMEYFDDFFNSDELNREMPNFNLVKFVISKDNFNIFYQYKALNEYIAFFEKFY